ncbi:tRNA (guanosine(37)-N1)-methyltransferase TrmD [Parvularcula sp. LCG005]|uniref:tRNA (guanosine(37)-N1)-methyltransferase TrmD n=1 Tax=Parvularcula sp. LCG005 TaxID=3078805 RepID=UPI0029438461|nr:tRNA (guanosine(37)-N1)-methyltransferase TrmD [Parvularcula sp. LCG005]WOI53234.1 tRNA (guanosine(37)-N1)-methyltransferase TrmD [Parvularcula sp. LCG005]
MTDQPWTASIITLYPDAMPGILGAGVLGRGLQAGHWALETVNPRDFADDKHSTVDDTPAGGGPGMVMRADILAKTIDSLGQDTRPRLVMSPRGRPFTQAFAHDLSRGNGAVFVCGRFEGIDQRVIDGRALEEVSIGDFVLAGGEIAAAAMIEACVRLIPGVLGAPSSREDESFEQGLLEYPQYTRPREFEGRAIPEILLSGDHGKIAAWRREEALKLTRARRPDLYEAWVQSGDYKKDDQSS